MKILFLVSSAEIGFWLGSHARGRGLGRATIELTLRWGFEELGVSSRIELSQRVRGADHHAN